MKLRLIEPSTYLSDGSVARARHEIFPSLTLPHLAALTPPGVDVSISIERLEGIDFDEPTDLVGITSYTTQILRAYDLADEFRARNVPVAMGGIHASMEPEEALEHADTVVVGEAEKTWPRFVADFMAGRARGVYRAEGHPPLDGLPRPRYELLDRSRFLALRRGPLSRMLRLPAYAVQTSRGCPHGCDFCSVTSFHGGRHRHRPVSDVVEEVRSLGARTVLFVDDNIFARPGRARQLFEALIPLKIIWMSQGSIAAARDEDLIRLAARSGCVGMCIGLESLSPASLRAVGKPFSEAREYERLLAVYRRHGLAVLASMMFGFDSDTPAVFRQTYEFLVRNRVYHTVWWPVTPLPGTPFYERLRSEGRLKHGKWWLNREIAGRFPRLLFTGGMDESVFRREFLHYYNKYLTPLRMVRRAFVRPLLRAPLRIASSFALKHLHASRLRGGAPPS